MAAPHAASRASEAPKLNESFTPDWLALGDGWRRLALTAWITAVVGITVFSLLPAFAPPGDYGFDKMVHAGAYFSLALLPHAAFARRRAAVMAALAMIPLGCAIEVVQAFVPGRYADGWDAVVNSIGALAAVALGARFRRIVVALARIAP
jgi:VanZ family protein